VKTTPERNIVINHYKAFATSVEWSGSLAGWVGYASVPGESETFEIVAERQAVKNGGKSVAYSARVFINGTLVESWYDIAGYGPSDPNWESEMKSRLVEFLSQDDPALV
jgi:hypothetical protein